MSGTVSSAAAPANAMLPSGYLSTKGNQIVDSAGNNVRIASVGWQRDFGLNDMWKTKEAGFNCVRISWVNATTDEDILRLKSVVAHAKTVGIKVIFDNHTNEPGHGPQDNWGAQQKNGLWYDVGGASDGTDGGGNRGTTSDAKFLQDWQKVAQAFKGDSTVIGFDIRNEPLAYGGMCTWGDGNYDTDIRMMYERVGNALQAIDPGKLIICEGPQNYATNYKGTGKAPWGDLSLAGEKPVRLNVPNKVVYSVHDYPVYVNGFNPTSGAEKVALMNTAWGYLVKQNIAPVWIGEMGANFDGSYAGENIDQSKAWAQTLFDYMNGKYGNLGGPTFSAGQYGVPGNWWVWGNLNGDQLNGTLNNDGTFRAAQKVWWDQMLMNAGSSGGGGGGGGSDPVAIPGVAAGTGPDTLVLKISGDAYANGDGTSDSAGHAAFTVLVDGKQVGGTFFALASKSLGQTQTFTLKGYFGTGNHTVTVSFLNDAYGGTTTTDRNLYIESVTYRGADTSQSATMMSGGAQTFAISGGTAATPTDPVIPSVTAGSGPDSLALKISGDAYANGDGTSDAAGHAAFTVTVDGKQVGGKFIALASKTAGQSQTFTLKGYFGAGNHTVAVTFLNDAYAGTPTTDRNLYIESITYKGANTNQSASMLSGGTQTFTIAGGTTPAIVASPDNTVIVAGSTAGITDKAGNVWKLASGKVSVNGLTDNTTANVKTLAFVKGKIWQENTSDLWWSKTAPTDAWNPSPGTATPPINVSVTSGTQTKVADATTAHQETDFGASINLTAPGVAKILIGSTATTMKFVSMSKVNLTAGTAAATVVADGGTHTFIGGKASLTLTGGAGGDSYIYHAGNARMSITDFSTAKGDTLTFDKSLQPAMKMASNGAGGTLISFGTLGAGVDLKGIAAVPTTAMRWV